MILCRASIHQSWCSLCLPHTLQSMRNSGIPLHFLRKGPGILFMHQIQYRGDPRGFMSHWKDFLPVIVILILVHVLHHEEAFCFFLTSERVYEIHISINVNATMYEFAPNLFILFKLLYSCPTKGILGIWQISLMYMISKNSQYQSQLSVVFVWIDKCE